MRALVVGARPDSLGEAIAMDLSRATTPARVVTAGISGEDERLDVGSTDAFEFFHRFPDFDVVVCTVGVNRPVPFDSLDFGTQMSIHFETNVMGPLRLLRGWQRRELPGNGHGQFVVISSNSAQIARTNSTPYCSSKAALSMAIRCVAREFAKSEDPQLRRRLVYAWEPGAIAGTGMTREVTDGLPAGVPLSRSPAAPRGLSRYGLARSVVATLLSPHIGLQGATLRVDGGEQ